MPSVKTSTAAAIALLHEANILADQDMQSLYGLPPSMFDSELDATVVQPSDRRNIAAFFAAARLVKGDKQKAFIQGTYEYGRETIGRKAYHTWFQSKVTRRLNKRIDDVLVAHDAHPKQILQADADDFPPTVTVSGEIRLPVMRAAFGERCLLHGRPQQHFHDCFEVLLHHTWERLRKARKREMSTLRQKKAALLEARTGA